MEWSKKSSQHNSTGFITVFILKYYFPPSPINNLILFSISNSSIFLRALHSLLAHSFLFSLLQTLILYYPLSFLLSTTVFAHLFCFIPWNTIQCNTLAQTFKKFCSISQNSDDLKIALFMGFGIYSGVCQFLDYKHICS